MHRKHTRPFTISKVADGFILKSDPTEEFPEAISDMFIGHNSLFKNNPFTNLIPGIYIEDIIMATLEVSRQEETDMEKKITKKIKEVESDMIKNRKQNTHSSPMETTIPSTEMILASQMRLESLKISVGLLTDYIKQNPLSPRDDSMKIIWEVADKCFNYCRSAHD